MYLLKKTIQSALDIKPCIFRSSADMLGGLLLGHNILAAILFISHSVYFLSKVWTLGRNMWGDMKSDCIYSEKTLQMTL